MDILLFGSLIKNFKNALWLFYKYYYRRLVLLFVTGAPASIIFRYYYDRIFKKRRITSFYAGEVRSFRRIMESLDVNQDWFSGNIPFWLYVFDRYGLRDKRDMRVLEIGSWEGLSSVFIFSFLPYSTLTCVDSWRGGYEHDLYDMTEIESRFDENTLRFKDRLIKYKGLSFSYYQDYFSADLFDVIYIDGSHYCDDVMIDCLKCFGMLKPGGIMILDDYFWRGHKERMFDNPAVAINSFLRMKRDLCEIIIVDYQIIVRKKDFF